MELSDYKKIPILIAVTIVASLVEIFLLRWKKKPVRYDLHESATSTLIFVFQAVEAVMLTGFTFLVYYWALKFQPFQFPQLPFWAWFPPALVMAELLYYWTHRYLHQVRLGWMNHFAHHTPKFYNLSMAYRVGPGIYLTLFGFFPLALLVMGFRIEWIIAVVTTNKLYQIWIHTELNPRLGWLENIIVMPSHHRVHHGRNPQYIDKNFGGVFIFFDKIFGTYQAEDPKIEIDYGVTEDVDSRSFIQSTFGGWMYMAKDLRHFPGLINKLRVFYKPPGWRPPGYEAPAPKGCSRKKAI